jgi:hypothetical protein
MAMGRYATAAGVCHTLLNEEIIDKVLVLWLNCAAVQAGALGLDWSPAEAKDVLSEADKASDEGQFEMWGGDVHDQMICGVINAFSLFNAGSRIAEATGRTRLGPFGHLMEGKKQVEMRWEGAVCDVCGAAGKTQAYGGCRVVLRVCSKKCQAKAWGAHTRECVQTKKILADLKAELLG